MELAVYKRRSKVSRKKQLMRAQKPRQYRILIDIMKKMDQNNSA
jgi:hypothetical protein